MSNSIADHERALTFLHGLLPQYDFVHDPHLRETPRRLAQSLKEMTTGQNYSFTVFEDHTDEMIVMRDVQFYSLCAHHVIPFFGQASIAYIPQGVIAGLSKLARAVKYWSKGLWTQEALTNTIHNHIDSYLSPRGTAVVMEARHLCMEMRGVSSPGAITTTSKMSGVFLDSSNQARQEFLSLTRTHS